MYSDKKSYAMRVAGALLAFCGSLVSMPAAAQESRPSTPESKVAIFGILHARGGAVPASPELIWVCREKASRSPTASLGAALTNDLGAFVLKTDLAPGNYVACTVGTESPFSISDTKSPFIMLNLTSAMDPPASTSRPASKAIPGTIIFGAISPPLSSKVIITIAPSDAAPKSHDKNISVLSNESGAFVFNETFPPGAYVVAAHLDGSTISQMPLVVKKNEPSHLVLQLTLATGGVNGRVVDSTGKPVGKAFVTIVNIAQHLAYAGTTDTNGRYSIKHVMPAQYIMTVSNQLIPQDVKSTELAAEVVVVDKKPVSKDIALTKINP